MRRTILVALVALVAMLALAPACSRSRSARQAAARQAADDAGLPNGSVTAVLDGVRIHYEVHGKGPILMTLPNSWGLSLEGLRVLYKPLEKDLTMVYFDPRGMGGSQPVRVDEDMGLAAVRADFDALRRHLGLARVDVIGWSNGAMNLILLAAEHPDTLSSAIFVHGPPRETKEEADQWVAQHPDLVARFTALAQEMNAPGLQEADKNRRTGEFFLENWLPLLFTDPEKWRPRLPEIYRGVGFSWRHFVYSEKETPSYDFTDRLEGIKTPSLVIAGAHDMAPVARVQELHDGIENSEFVVFENSGHFSPLEEPEAFRRAVLTFLGVTGS